TPPARLAVRCVTESTPRGPVAGLLAEAPRLAGQPALVLLGDEYYEDWRPFEALAGRTQIPDLLLGVVDPSPPHRILCNVERDTYGRIRSVREKPPESELRGSCRWCGLAGFAEGVLGQAGPEVALHCTHVGDLLAYFLVRGASAQALDFRELHLNLNTPEEALAASLVEA